MLAGAVSDAPTTTPATDWLTLEQAAHRAQLHVVTLRRAILAGRLRATRVNNGRVYRLRASWLDSWLENSTN